MPVFFDSQQLPTAQAEYVTWMDVMGIGPVMGRSLDISANFIFKLHLAALHAPSASVRLYPVMDGFYASSPNQQTMLDFLTGVFEQCADTFISTPTTSSFHRFIVRGALAFGPVIHGHTVPNSAAQPPGAPASIFTANANYKDSVLIGLPMVQAHLCEKLAPPFGLYVHESARSFAPQGQSPVHFTWWRWGSHNNPYWSSLLRELRNHYQWCKQRAQAIEYEEDRIEAHEKMVNQYFA